MEKVEKSLLKKLKNEKGAITALVLASLLLIAIVFINLYMMQSNKISSQNKELEMIEDDYNVTEDEMKTAYEEAKKNTIIKVDAETIASDPDYYYGKKAENYTQGDLTYRIFYVDTDNRFKDGKNTIYLKADWVANDRSLVNYINYVPSESDLNTYKIFNPDWAASGRASLSPSSNWKRSECAAAWLCSPSQWTEYCDPDKANYAIGSPSIELYVASYNQVSHSVGTPKGQLGAQYSAKADPGYIYTINNAPSEKGDQYHTGDDTIDYVGYESMYCGKDGKKGSNFWWIASPSSRNSTYVCYSYGINAYLYYGDTNAKFHYGICPIISLKQGVEVEIQV